MVDTGILNGFYCSSHKVHVTTTCFRVNVLWYTHTGVRPKDRKTDNHTQLKQTTSHFRAQVLYNLVLQTSSQYN